MDMTTIGKIYSGGGDTVKVMNGNNVVWSGQINPTIVPDSYIISAGMADYENDNSNPYNESYQYSFSFWRHVSNFIFIKGNTTYVLVDLMDFLNSIKNKGKWPTGIFLSVNGDINHILSNAKSIGGYQEIYSETNMLERTNYKPSTNGTAGAYISIFSSIHNTTHEQFMIGKYALFAFDTPLISDNVMNIIVWVKHNK